MTQAPNELGVTLDPMPAQTVTVGLPGGGAYADQHAPAPAPAPAAPKAEPTPEEKFQQASSVMWPTKKYAGRTLGQVMGMDPSAIEWLANRFNGNPEASAAAKYMCEYAMSHQSV